ncbi:MAG: cysteine peptidase family C39 domain-containing protein [Pirellulales bacterium]|nr:cysteine peptidase family C39 domain-containing protein [Pirellulales bacterium]
MITSVLFAVQGVFFVAATAYGFRSARRDPELTLENALHRSWALVVVLVTATVVFAVTLAAEFYDPICQQLPLIIQRYVGWIAWGVLLVAFAAMAGFAWSLSQAWGKERSGRLLAALIALNVVLAVFAYRWLAPIAHQLGPGKVVDGIVMQTSGETCVAASLANVARHFGISLDERQAAELLLTSREGTTRGQLRYALSRLGLSFKTVSVDALSDVTPPAVLFVDHSTVGHEGHAAIFMRRLPHAYEIWDPIDGREFWTEAESRKSWHGNAIEVTGPGP